MFPFPSLPACYSFPKVPFTQSAFKLLHLWVVAKISLPLLFLLLSIDWVSKRECVCRCHAQVELCDKYNTNIHTFQHKSEELEGCNPRRSIAEHTTNKKMRKDKHGIPRFCASMYIANNMGLSLVFVYFSFDLPFLYARLPMSTSNQALHARALLVRVSLSFSLYLSVCMCPTLFFFTPTLQNPYPFSSLPSPPPIPIPNPHP